MRLAQSVGAGKVYLVGAGPGDAKLITLRGKDLLEVADTIIYDYLANPKLLDFSMGNAEKIYVGKRGGSRSSEHQAKINRLMIDAARMGKIVVRLKGGDPFIFGRGGEELEALAAASIPFEVVPGVSSAMSVPTYAGIPLTHRERASSITIVTGHENPAKGKSHLDWEKLATGADTLVVLMGMGNFSSIIQALIRHGRSADTPIALTQWGGYPYQKTIVGHLKNILEKAGSESIKPPVVMVIGEVVSLRKKLNWFESLPLFGRRILVTRAEEQAGEFSDLLSRLGADALSFPTLRMMPPPQWNAVDDAIARIESYDALIFTSVNGVRFFRQRLRALRKDLRLLKGIFLCAIGPRTAKEIEAWDLRVDLTPSEFKAEGLLAALEKYGIKGKRFLLPRAMEAREILPDEIRRAGGVVDVVPVYQALRPRYCPDTLETLFKRGPIDMLSFASSSTLRNFVAMIGKEELQSRFKESAIACIGPVTAETARQLGLKVDVMPKTYTIPALAEAIVDYFKEKR